MCSQSALGARHSWSERSTARGAFQAPGSRRRARGMMLWSSCFPQAPASGAAQAGTAAATAWEGERKKGRGLERLGGGRRRGGEGGSERGGNLPPLQCLRLSSLAGGDWVLPSHPLPVPCPLLHPSSCPPSLPSVQEGSRSQRAA